MQHYVGENLLSKASTNLFLIPESVKYNFVCFVFFFDIRFL